MYRKFLVVIITLFVLAQGLPEALAASSGQRIETHFNVPGDWGNSGPIDDEVVAAIDLAGPAAEIRAAWYYAYPSNPVIEALNDALGRGVDVRLILDEDAVDKNSSRISRQSFSDNGEPLISSMSNFRREDVVFCKDSCSPLGGSSNIMHNKFILISESGTDSDVVIQSSRNLSNAKMYENAVFFYGHDLLYDRYERLWTRLAHRDLASPYDTAEISGRDGAVKVYAFPRENGPDTAVSILGNVNTSESCTVRVAMAFFTSGRDAVADKLRELDAAGCTVVVITKGADSSDADLADLNVRRTDDLHSKYLLIDAVYAGGPERERLVWTGSHNYTEPALRYNDEVMLRIADPGVYNDFDADFGSMWTDQIGNDTVTISAVVADGPGVENDGGEWVELTNNLPVAVDVGGWKLKDRKGGNGAWRTSFVLPSGTVLPAFETLTVYVIQGGSGPGSLNLDVSPFLNNGGDHLKLVDGSSVVDERCYSSSVENQPVSLQTNC